MRHDSQHRGLALLVVLAALVLTLPLATAIARSAALRRLDHRLDNEVQIADDLMNAAEVPIVDWLNSRSASIALPLDAIEPRVEVLHNNWRSTDGGIRRVRITAYDQLGMISLEAALAAASWRLTLPPEIASRLDSAKLTIRDSTVLGLDIFDTHGAGADVFPAGANSDQAIRQLALGACLATHGHDGSRLRLNVNTAPIPLLETAMRIAQIDQLSIVMQARREERPAMIGGLHTSPNDSLIPTFVTSSDTWAFRVDAEVGAVMRSRWVVFERNGSEWKVAQRLVISE